MANQLTHGLLAVAIMTIINSILGTEPISWNVFLAGMAAMVLGFDAGNSRISGGSPVGHSLGFGIFLAYLAGTAGFLSYVFLGIPLSLAAHIALAVSVGVFTHLLAEVAAGEQIFTFPNNLKPESWVVKCDCGSMQFWSAWNRFSLHGRHLRDSHVNAFSLATIILCIGLF